jgi:hypothetical protein
MPMLDTPILNTVFDTNAYLGIGQAGLHELVGLEKNAGVFTLASVWPCLELLACAGGADERKAERARSKIAKIWSHSGYMGVEGPRLRMHESGEVSLVRGLFGRTPNEPILECGFVADLIVAAVGKDPAEFHRAYQTELQAVTERVRLEKAQFCAMASDPEHRKALSGIPRETVTESFAVVLIAAGLVTTLAEKYNVRLEEIDVTKAVRSVVLGYPVAMQFVRDLLDDSRSSGGVPGGANTAWDLKIAFHAAPGAAVSRVPTLLVSKDRRLLRAARGVKAEQWVMPLPEYKALLQSPAAVAEHARRLTAWSNPELEAAALRIGWKAKSAPPADTKSP